MTGDNEYQRMHALDLGQLRALVEATAALDPRTVAVELVTDGSGELLVRIDHEDEDRPPTRLVIDDGVPATASFVASPLRVVDGRRSAQS
jgi:hypothetical protein